jgi:hypothetical protein
VVACGVSVCGGGDDGHFGSFYGRARHHLLAHKGYPCVEKDHVKTSQQNMFINKFWLFWWQLSGCGGQ